MTATYTIFLAFSAFLFTYVGTALLLWALPKLSVMDTPGERSNHVTPTPRGAGLAVVISAVGFMTVSGAHTGIVLGALVLMLMSFLDDRKPLPVHIRLAAQAMVVVFALTYFEYGLVFQGLLPWWLDRALAGLLWLWFLNLYNFMDGIDEITATQTASIATGLIFLAISEAGVKNFLAVDGAIIGGAVMAFWLFNRHPAKIFLGDSGSVPLGFLTGFLLLVLAAEGQWEAALILPAYYLCDATLTLLKRLLAGKKIWQAHSEHAYQRAVRAGRTHDDVARHVLALNMILITLSVVSLLGGTVGYLSLAAAYGLSLALMAYFRKAPVKTALPAASHA